MRRLIALTSIFVVLTVNHLWAEEGSTGHLYPAVGLAGFIGGDGYSNALQMSFGLGYELAKPVDVVLRFGYHPFASTGGLFADASPIYVVGGDVRLFQASEESPLNLFAFGGGGQYTPNDFRSPWYANFGFGLEFRISKHLNLFGEYRRYSIRSDFTAFMFGVKI